MGSLLARSHAVCFLTIYRVVNWPNNVFAGPDVSIRVRAFCRRKKKGAVSSISVSDARNRNSTTLRPTARHRRIERLQSEPVFVKEWWHAGSRMTPTDGCRSSVLRVQAEGCPRKGAFLASTSQDALLTLAMWGHFSGIRLLVAERQGRHGRQVRPASGRAVAPLTPKMFPASRRNAVLLRNTRGWRSSTKNTTTRASRSLVSRESSRIGM